MIDMRKMRPVFMITLGITIVGLIVWASTVTYMSNEMDRSYGEGSVVGQYKVTFIDKSGQPVYGSLFNEIVQGNPYAEDALQCVQDGGDWIQEEYRCDYTYEPPSDDPPGTDSVCGVPFECPPGEEWMCYEPEGAWCNPIVGYMPPIVGGDPDIGSVRFDLTTFKVTAQNVMKDGFYVRLWLDVDRGDGWFEDVDVKKYKDSEGHFSYSYPNSNTWVATIDGGGKITLDIDDELFPRTGWSWDTMDYLKIRVTLRVYGVSALDGTPVKSDYIGMTVTIWNRN